MLGQMTEEEQRRQIARLDYELYTEEAHKRLEYEVKFAEMVFKALVLVNGGAMVALFSLVGALGSHNELHLVLAASRLWLAFLAFSIGLIATLSAGICAYFTQRYFSESTVNQAWIAQAASVGAAVNAAWSDKVIRYVTVGNRWLVAAIAAVVIASAGFVIGCGMSLLAVLPQ